MNVMSEVNSHVPLGLEKRSLCYKHWSGSIWSLIGQLRVTLKASTWGGRV